VNEDHLNLLTATESLRHGEPPPRAPLRSRRLGRRPVLAIPVAAGVFYPSFGWSLRPEVSALLMSFSSIIVAVNAGSLRRAKI
jgi:hypothetical protein